MFGSSEILIVAIVVLVLFGATALPKFFRSLGKAKSEFQKGVSDSTGVAPEASSSANESRGDPGGKNGNAEASDTPRSE